MVKALPECLLATFGKKKKKGLETLKTTDCKQLMNRTHKILDKLWQDAEIDVLLWSLAIWHRLLLPLLTPKFVIAGRGQFNLYHCKNESQADQKRWKTQNVNAPFAEFKLGRLIKHISWEKLTKIFNMATFFALKILGPVLEWILWLNPVKLTYRWCKKLCTVLFFNSNNSDTSHQCYQYNLCQI